MKQLSLAYAIKFSGGMIFDMLKPIEYITMLSTGASEEEKKAGIGAIPNLNEIAATSAGLKALCTFLATEGIEDCRKACGGNGYLLNSGIAQIAADYVWQTTAEGDYILLMLLTGRYLLKVKKPIL